MFPKRKIRVPVIVLLVLAIATLVTYPAGQAISSVVKPGNSLRDVTGHWAHEQIEKWLAKGLVKGYPDRTFQPEKEISRAEFVTLVNRAFNKQKALDENKFTDLKTSDWYYQEVLKAQNAGYISGYPDGTFQPNKAISRQEVAEIVYRLLELPEVNLDSVSKFVDAGTIPDWSRAKIETLVNLNLMTGYPDGTFRADKLITRAEAVVTLDRALTFFSSSQPPSRGNNGNRPTEPPPSTSPENSPPSTPAQGKNIMGYYVRDWPQDNASQQTLESYGDLLTTIGNFSFSVDENGNLNGAHDAQAMETARRKNVKVLALIHNIFGNSTKSKNVAKAVLSNPSVRTKVVTGIFNLMERYGYDGVNIDIEYVAPADRNNYTTFIKELAAKLRPRGYAVTVSVPAKLKDDPNHGWSGGFDYAALNNYADLFMIMSYDEHGYVSGPGPIASIRWDEQIIKYTLSVLPAEKILLGIPTYGFDWTIGGGAPRYLSYRQAVTLAQQQNKTILWDDVAKVPYFKYTSNGQNHEVWFENARSMEEKLKLVNKYNLAGIAIWRLGFEDPAAWEAIDRVLDIQK